MKLSRLLPLIAIAVSGACSVPDNGPRQTRDLAFSGFDSLLASDGVNVTLTQGPFGVRLEAPEGRLERIRVEQSGTTLAIGLNPGTMLSGSRERYAVSVSAPSVSMIAASGGAAVEAGPLQSEQLTLRASGGADIDIADVRIGALEASASGGGAIDIAGACTRAVLAASGGGDVDGEALDCDSVTAEASGGGDIDAGVGATAHGKASGGGDVRFLGSPATFTREVSGGGDVTLTKR